jgi:hypothetical protein
VDYGAIAILATASPPFSWVDDLARSFERYLEALSGTGCAASVGCSSIP